MSGSITYPHVLDKVVGQIHSQRAPLSKTVFVIVYQLFPCRVGSDAYSISPSPRARLETAHANTG